MLGLFVPFKLRFSNRECTCENESFAMANHQNRHRMQSRTQCTDAQLNSSTIRAIPQRVRAGVSVRAVFPVCACRLFPSLGRRRFAARFAGSRSSSRSSRSRSRSCGSCTSCLQRQLIRDDIKRLVELPPNANKPRAVANADIQQFVPVAEHSADHGLKPNFTCSAIEARVSSQSVMAPMHCSKPAVRERSRISFSSADPSPLPRALSAQ